MPSWKDYSFERYCELLGKTETANGTLYRGSYMFNDELAFGGDRNGKPYDRKYKGSLRLVQRLIEDGVVESIQAATTMEDIFKALGNGGKYLAFSDGFLCMQLAYDIGYSDINSAGEDDFWPIRGGNGYSLR